MTPCDDLEALQHLQLLQATFAEMISGSNLHIDGDSSGSRFLIRGLSEPPLLDCERNGAQIEIRVYLVDGYSPAYERIYLCTESGIVDTSNSWPRSAGDIAHEALVCMGEIDR